jgi:hypothetical protein
VKPVKKSKRRQARREEIEELMDPRTQKRFQNDADNAFIDFEELVNVRFAYAEDILQVQGNAVHAIVVALVENMQRMVPDPQFFFKGIAVPVDDNKLREIQEKNFTWIAVRLLAACAIWEIEISGFKLPEYACAKCGIGTRPKKRR